MTLNEDELKEKLDEQFDDNAAEAEISPEVAANAAEEAIEEGPAVSEVDFAAEADRLKEELADKEDKMKRLQADFENFRRRTGKEKEELSAVVTQMMMKDMLPLLDNFERALSAPSEGEAFKTGIDMIYKQFVAALKEHGLEYIDVSEAKFDPNYHQAVMRVQDPEKEDDTIAAELQKGYMVKGKVIRPSMVQVVSN